MGGPYRYQVAIRMSALSSIPRSAQVYRNCAHSHGKSMHAVACPILVIPLVSKIPCRNILSFACVCTRGWGGHKKGSRENDLLAMSERKIIGLMSLSSNCARSEDLTWGVILALTHHSDVDSAVHTACSSQVAEAMVL